MTSASRFSVFNPWTGECLEELASTTPEAVNRAAVVAAKAAQEFKDSTPFDRRALLFSIANSVEREADALALLICAEVGKTYKEARREVVRAQNTLRLSAEAAGQMDGEILHCSVAEKGAGRLASITYQPVGVVAAITPFNYPLNLLCHKIGPSLAAGNAIVVKPSPKAPLTAIRLVQLIQELSPVPDLVQIIHGDGGVAIDLVKSKINLLSFTGGPHAGLALKQASGLVRCLMELGGNDPIFVLNDADLEMAAQTAISHRFELAGQSCSAVKKLYVHESVHAPFMELLLSLMPKITTGNPIDIATEMGPVIDDAAGIEVAKRIHEAVDSGAKCLWGQVKVMEKANRVWPTVLDDVSVHTRLWSLETFGPVLAVRQFVDIDHAVDEVNRSGFGLQAGIFSNNHEVIKRVSNRLEVGGVMVNEGPDFRVEHVPFGGMKSSGMGREGVRIAMREMSELKVVVD
jgi:acyl-CoA reductase-like NAD-dependent aldehyde dehydrogenase